jgi:hypothetical protein
MNIPTVTIISSPQEAVMWSRDAELDEKWFWYAGAADLECNGIISLRKYTFTVDSHAFHTHLNRIESTPTDTSRKRRCCSSGTISYPSLRPTGTALCNSGSHAALDIDFIGKRSANITSNMTFLHMLCCSL